MTLTTTVLSTRGGFSTRRNGQMQDKKQQMEHTLYACSSLVSCSRLEEATVATHDKQQQESIATTAATTTTTTVTTRASAGYLTINAKHSSYHISTANYWLLGALLLILTVSCLPNTTALPRHLFGRHLIHRHHVHLRSAGQDSKEPCGIVHKNQTINNIKLNCSHLKTFGSKMSITLHNITQALTVCKDTREGILSILTRWLSAEENIHSVQHATDCYKLHELNLTHSLMEETKISDYTGEDTKSPEEELPKILDALSVVEHLINAIIYHNETHPNLTKQYFRYFSEKIYHNKFVVAEMLQNHSSCVDIPEYTYNSCHPLLMFATVWESVKVLNVMEKKYGAMIRKMNNN